MNICFIFTDIDECREKKACQCPECSCKNTWGSYDCSCSGDLLYMRDHDTCISELNIHDILLDPSFSYACYKPCFMPSNGLPTGKIGSQGRSTWAAFWLILLGVVMISGGAFLVYKYRIRVSSATFFHFAVCMMVELSFIGYTFNGVLFLWFCSNTWILKSEQSWHNICPWTAKQKFQIMWMMKEHEWKENYWGLTAGSMGVGFSCTIMFESFWIFTLNSADCMYDMEM